MKWSDEGVMPETFCKTRQQLSTFKEKKRFYSTKAQSATQHLIIIFKMLETLLKSPN